MIVAIELGIAFILDLILGDPTWLPHPIIWIGKAISKTKKWIQKKIYGCTYEEVLTQHKKRPYKSELKWGAVLTFFIVSVSFCIPYFILLFAGLIHPYLRYVLETFWMYQIFATKCLKQEAMKVYAKLKEEDLKGARIAISYLVGRDTQSLSAAEVTKATIETVAENTADGIIAPLFYMTIGGAPLGMAYKAVNTLDSMVGYKNEEFLYLGRISAMLDDVANYIPARISAVFMIIASLFCGFDAKNAWKIFKRDRYQHLSPNSAQTESVAAGALGLQLGGVHDYFGKPVVKPTIGDPIREVEAEDIKKTNQLLYGASIIATIAGVFVRLLIWKLITG